IEMGAGVLAAREIVPVPRGPATVVFRNLLQTKGPRFTELRRQLNHCCARIERLAKVHYSNRARRQSLRKLRQNVHALSLGIFSKPRVFVTTKYATVSTASHGRPARIATRIPSTHRMVAIIAMIAAQPAIDVNG